VGLVLKDLGDHAGVQAVFERALVIWEKTPGPDHPNVQIVKGNLEILEG